MSGHIEAKLINPLSFFGLIAVVISFALSALADPAGGEILHRKIVSTLALTNIFDTKSKWDIFVIQDNESDTEMFDPPFFHLCFENNNVKQSCMEGMYNISLNASIVHSSTEKSRC